MSNFNWDTVQWAKLEVDTLKLALQQSSIRTQSL